MHFSLLWAGVEKIIGWAVSHHFMNSAEVSAQESVEVPAKDAKLVISNERFPYHFCDFISC